MAIRSVLYLVEIIVLCSWERHVYPGIYMDAGKLLIASFFSINSQPKEKNGIIIAIGTVLCLSLICVFAVLLYRYTHICKSR